MKQTFPLVGRRGLVTRAAAYVVLSLGVAKAQGSSGDSPVGPVAHLDDALLASMKGGERMSFDARYRMLAPVIDQVFSLDTVLANSIGLSWASLPAERKAELSAAFRRYTVSSYVSNFNSYNGQSFQISPFVRSVGEKQVVVQTHLIRADDSPLDLSYVVSATPVGWQVVDVLMNGSISRVAVQRSDFRELLRNGGVPALVAGLQSKVASLSGGMAG